MRLRLERCYLKDKYTIGKLYVNDTYFCDTLELPIKDGLSGSAIKEGIYRLILSYSNRFGRVLPELLYVPDRIAIRIHTGNTVTDTEGCILVGKNNDIGRVNYSKHYMEMLMSLLTGIYEKIYIEVC